VYTTSYAPHSLSGAIYAMPTRHSMLLHWD
jgi:hypothetical protein